MIILIAESEPESLRSNYVKCTPLTDNYTNDWKITVTIQKSKL